MFTGIIESAGKINKLIRKKDRSTFTVYSKDLALGLCIGDSVSVNGVCLTVTNRVMNEFEVEAVPETLSKTTLGDLRIGDTVNLERALRTDGRFNGHIVTGHVDSRAAIIDIQTGAVGLLFEIVTPPNFSKLVVDKGSISIDGISLTIAKVKTTSFIVAVIPYTFENTNFKHKRVGDIVNIEFDILGKYVERILSERYPGEWASVSDKKIDLEFLKKAGLIS